MGRSGGNIASLLALFLCLLAAAEASHRVYGEFQTAEERKLAAGEDKLRTGFHFRPPKNWINDPNGPMYYKGFYHLFYQYNPKGAVWGNIVWAHSVSKDLIIWAPLPPAIYPSKPFDVNGCWSGSATLLPNGIPAILYTGIDGQNRQVQNIAFPKDPTDPYLREWVKPDYNPVIDPDSAVNASAFRDPTTAWLGPDRTWRVTVGSKVDLRGLAILYKSRDFKTWVKAAAPLHAAEGTGMWECPDFYPVATRGRNGLDTSAISQKYVFKVSLDLTRFEYYTIGSYSLKEDRFSPENGMKDDRTGLRYDYGNFYASKTFFDPAKGRRILWGWSNESDSVGDDVAKGWAGVQTVPRAVWLDEGGRQLVQWPVRELRKLRGMSVAVRGLVLAKGQHYEVKGISTSQADVEATFEIKDLDKAEAFDPSWTDAQRLCQKSGADVSGGVGPFGLWVLSSADLRERTAVFFRVFKGQDKKKHVVLMCHDDSRSTSRAGVWKPSFAGFVDIDIEKDRKISLRSLIDASVVESFGAGGKTCITSRVYPVHAVGAGAHLFAFNNGAAAVKISGLRAWEMGAANLNRAL